MQRKHRLLVLCAIFALTLGARLYFALETRYFSDDSAYYTLRQIASIKETGHLISDDPLSYGGRTSLVLPVFYYLLAVCSFFFDPVIVGKVVPNILAASLVFIVFLIVRRLTKDDDAALLTAFISGFIPIYFSETVNSISITALTIPLTFTLIYLLLRIDDRNALTLFLLSIALFVVTSPTVILFVLAMGLYVVLLWVEGMLPSRAEIELCLFSIFLVTWFYFFFYQTALLTHGIGIIWQNMPSEVITQYFTQIDLLSAIYQIGVIPLVCGVLIIYHYLFRRKEKSMYLFISFVVVMTMLLLFRWIQLRLGLMYLGVLLTILFSMLFFRVFTFLSKTKIAPYRIYLMGAVFVLFILTSLLPSLTSAGTKVIGSTNSDTVVALSMLSNFSEEPDMIVGTVFEGHVINYYAHRRSITDTNFILAPNVQERLRDTRTIYTSAIESKPLEIMRKYSADYIMFTNTTKQYYNITKIAYADGECFPLIYSGKEVTLYQRTC
jgi:hypothetical protein